MKLWIYPYPEEGWENLSRFSVMVYRNQPINNSPVIEVVTKDEVEKLESTIEILREDLRKLANQYEERRSIMMETSDTVRSLYIPKIEKLKREIEILRHFGNRDCTAIADDAIQSMETK